MTDYSDRRLKHVALVTTGPLPASGDEINVAVEMVFSLEPLGPAVPMGPSVELKFSIAVPDDMLAKDIAGKAIAQGQSLLSRFAGASREEVDTAHLSWIESLR